MENNKQTATAVEWLEGKLSQILDFDLIKLFEQAKEMEKYQIFDAYVQGTKFKVDTSQSTPDGIEPEIMGAVDYYNNIYNK